MNENNLKRTKINPRPVAGEAPGGDWFFDELMTAQPEATRDYFRARLKQATPKQPPRKG